jgi:hypothetical protein
MRIIGCDLHAAQQTIAMLNRETGEIDERILKHEGTVVRELLGLNRRPLHSARNFDSRSTASTVQVSRRRTSVLLIKRRREVV